MAYLYSKWLAHPGRNPAHNPLGRQRSTMKNPLNGQEFVVRGPRNPSRWLPHIGVKQRSRRLGGSC